MQVSSAMLADAATVANGKLFIFGGQWDRIWAASVPVTHPTLAIAFVVQVDYAEALQDHLVAVHLELDGTPAGPRVEGTFRTGHDPFTTRGAAAYVPFAMTFNAIKFEAIGRYEWVVSLDGDPKARLPIELTVKPT